VCARAVRGRAAHTSVGRSWTARPGASHALPLTAPGVTALVLLPLLLQLAPASWEALDEAGRAQALAELQPLPLQERLLAASERFLGTPYGYSPLGEGEGVDPDPRLRFDSVDCVTFVEETMALALARRPEEVLPLLDRIRYRDGIPGYAGRNHLMEAGWLPANTAAGFARDVTLALGGKDAVVAQKVLGQKAWEGEVARGLALPVSAHVTGTFASPLSRPTPAPFRTAPSFWWCGRTGRTASQG